jgi:serine/threonine-protein kinase
MEFVDGKPLSHVIPAKGLPFPQAMRYSMQIVDAVACAHNAGIIHRDLKPENILLTRNDQIKIVDFGLAKRTFDSSGLGATQDNLTTPGAFLGTIYYAAPEQHLNLPIDQRSDIFSLGVILFGILTGEMPFEGKNLLDLVQAISRCEPRSVTQFRPSLPAVFDAIIVRALQQINVCAPSGGNQADPDHPGRYVSYLWLQPADVVELNRISRHATFVNC